MTFPDLHTHIQLIGLALGFIAGVIATVTSKPLYAKASASIADWQAGVRALDSLIEERKALLANTAPTVTTANTAN